MRRIEHTTAFKRDYKREKRSRHGKGLGELMTGVLAMLMADRPLPPTNRDHALSGNWKDHRDCHLKPDLLLLYRKPDMETLQLVRLGSHSELFG